jgi:3-methyladenine DNA glycosylase AlkC
MHLVYTLAEVCQETSCPKTKITSIRDDRNYKSGSSATAVNAHRAATQHLEVSAQFVSTLHRRVTSCLIISSFSSRAHGEEP